MKVSGGDAEESSDARSLLEDSWVFIGNVAT